MHEISWSTPVIVFDNDTVSDCINVLHGGIIDLSISDASVESIALLCSRDYVIWLLLSVVEPRG